MMTTTIAILCVAAVVLAAVVMFVAFRSQAKHQKAQFEERLAESSTGYEARLSEAAAGYEARLTEAAAGYEARLTETTTRYEKFIADLRTDHQQRVEELKTAHDKAIRELKEENEASLARQIEAVKTQITAESEKVLKSRQEEFSKHAAESFNTIAGDVNKSLNDMKTAFEANKKTQTDTSAELRTSINAAVNNLKDQTRNIGEKADRLATALKGENKAQGCWGETQLANLLLAEGFVEGRDFDKEETLRDELGIVIHNEESGKKMRPDFILHYPDKTDIVVDCKVNLKALADYFSATDDDARKDASQRNLEAIKAQVEGLAKKDYNSYLRTGHKCLDYVIMYVPNVNALVLARQLDPHIIADAFRKNVLIASEETFMPFLRLVRSAWINYAQVRNQEKIVAAAQRMVDRVADFSKCYVAVGKGLEDAVKNFRAGEAKLREDGHSIVHAAHEVVSLGVKASASKTLPPVVSANLTPELPVELSSETAK